MSEPISWRGLTLEWDADQERYVCGRWSLGMPRGRWKGVWSDTALYVAGASSAESPGAAMDSLCIALAETLKTYQLEAGRLTAKIDRMGDDLASLKGEPYSEQAP